MDTLELQGFLEQDACPDALGYIPEASLVQAGNIQHGDIQAEQVEHCGTPSLAVTAYTGAAAAVVAAAWTVLVEPTCFEVRPAAVVGCDLAMSTADIGYNLQEYNRLHHDMAIVDRHLDLEVVAGNILA